VTARLQASKVSFHFAEFQFSIRQIPLTVGSGLGIWGKYSYIVPIIPKVKDDRSKSMQYNDFRGIAISRRR